VQKYKETLKYAELVKSIYIKQFVDYKVNRIFEFSQQLRENDVVIFGRGIGAIELYKQLAIEGANTIAFVDSESIGVEDLFCGKKVISYEDLKELNGKVNVVISTKNPKYSREIAEKLNNDNINNLFTLYPIFPSIQYEVEEMKKLVENENEKIQKVYESLVDQRSKQVFMNMLSYRLSNDVKLLELSNEINEAQYFPNGDIIALEEDEVFIDAGGYTGDTILEFIHKTKGKYKKIYSFEPDEMLYVMITTLIQQQKISNVEVLPYGLYHSAAELSFWNGNETGSSKISEVGLTKIKTVKLDDVIPQDVKVSYIKMDIEGVEREALQGADNIIKRNYPKLAISIYHKEDDLWEIPYQILTNYPEYQIYIRHYRAYEATETVCYAVRR